MLGIKVSKWYVFKAKSNTLKLRDGGNFLLILLTLIYIMKKKISTESVDLF